MGPSIHLYGAELAGIDTIIVLSIIDGRPLSTHAFIVSKK